MDSNIRPQAPGRHASGKDQVRQLPPEESSPAVLPAVRADGSRVYRNTPDVVFRSLAFLPAGVLLIVGGCLDATHPQPGESLAGTLAGAAVLCGIGVALTVLGIRTLRSAIIAGPQGATIRSIIARQRTVPWREVTAIELVSAPRYSIRNSSAVAAAIIAADGRPRYCAGSAFPATAPGSARMVRALRREWQERLGEDRDGRGPSAAAGIDRG